MLLIEAIPAQLDGAAVTILDADDDGVVVEHSIAQLDLAAPHRLQFAWEGIDLDLPCRIASSALQDLLSDRLQKLTWHARVAISDAAFARALQAYRTHLDDAQRANLVGDLDAEPPSSVILGAGSALREHKPGYRSFVFRQGTWTIRDTRSPEQPMDGFTVAEFETDEQITLLKLAYEEADREGRELLRRFAAASLEPQQH